MIKVRVVRGVKTALPFASGLVALSGAVAACAPPASEDVGVDDGTLTVVDPGTGVFELVWAYGSPTGYEFTAKGSRDEYVRALQKMTFSIPAWYLWSQLHPSHATPDVDRLKQLSAKVTITFYRDGGSYAETSVTTNDWEGSHHIYGVRATTQQFVVDRHAQGMRFSIEVTDHGASPPMKKVLDDSSFFEQPVIGGTLPQKTLLFDSVGASLRSRVLEGGQPVQDADLAIAYTDWRAATLVDASMIDRRIGTATSYGRFGSFELPIHGDLEYEVSYGVAIDGVWQEEQMLVANAQSRLVPQGRTAYEGKISVPQGAGSLQLYFHVKAFLKVDYSKYPDVRERRYPDGTRLLVRERWDNENGSTNDHYDFATEAQ